MTCPNCGENNPSRARFCLNCGAPIGMGGTTQTEERKVVSVLFADLVGFTARAHYLDPEDVRVILRLFHSRLKQEIERRGGRVEKFVGDAAVGVFGAPVAHEDDAERAVRAGFAVVDAVRALNEAQPELGLSVRIAVNTGEVVVDLTARPEFGEAMIAGDVVNTAARLQQVAPIDGVVVGDLTHRITKNFIDFEAPKEIRLKGKPDPVTVWTAKSPRSRLSPTTTYPLRTSLVGRSDEMGLLKNTYRRALRESTVQLVTIAGEPGVGKSRLVREFGAFLDEQTDLVFWRHGHCLSYGEGITFWPLSEIVKSHLGILETDSHAEASEKLAVAVRAVIEWSSEYEWFESRLAPLVGIPQETSGMVERGESFTAWRRFLEAIALARPLVMVVEDLHWAGAPMLEFLEYLLEWSRHVPLLILCTARPEFLAQHPGWGGRAGDATMIPLKPLSDNETADLMAQLLPEAHLSNEIRNSLLERSGGNPLYAEEFAQMLNDRGLLKGDPGILATTDVPVPETLQSIIAARLDGLPTAQKALLHNASVIGGTFWSGALSSMTHLEEDAVQRELHELERREFLRVSRTSSVAGTAECYFWHQLIRDVSYGQIPRLVRSAKHRMAAEWVEDIARERVADRAELIAFHYREALLYARISHADQQARRLEAPTRRFLLMAGDQATRLDAAKAHDYYRQALDLFDAADPEAPRVLAKEAEAAWFAGQQDGSETEKRYREAIAVLLDSGDDLSAGEAMVKLSHVVWDRGGTALSRDLLVEAIHRLEQEPPSAQLAYAYAQMAGERWASGESTECIEWAEKALALARAHNLNQHVARAMGFRGCARCDLGDFDGLDDLREALRLAVKFELGRETAVQYNNLGYVVWLIEGPRPALDIYRKGIEFAGRRGLIREMMWLKVSSLEPLYDLGQWQELLSLSDEVIDWDRRHGSGQHGVFALWNQLQVFFWRGETDRLNGPGEELLARARTIGESGVLVPALALAVLISSTQPDKGNTALLSNELGTLLRDRFLEWSRHLTDVVRALSTARSTEVIGSVLAEVEDIPLAPRRAHSVLMTRAMLAEGRRDLNAATDLYAAAADRWKQYPCLPEHGHACLGMGQCLVALDKRDLAIDPLRDALRAFRVLEARPLIAQTEDLLRLASRDRDGLDRRLHATENQGERRGS